MLTLVLTLQPTGIPFGDLLREGDARAAVSERTAALAAYEAAAWLCPLDPEPYLQMAQVNLDWGRMQDARIAVARAAVRNAPILILDEPTVSLDEENEQAVMQALERLAEDRTTFVIAHDLLLASRADVIFFLEGGRLCERGSHEELMRANGRYARLYALQAAAFDPSAEERLRAQTF